MITAAVESFMENLPTLKPILPLHYAELALDQDKVPLDPMYEVYEVREERGELLFVTIRKDGDLIGYFIGIIAPGLHYRTCLTLTMDIFYVHPEHRGGRGGFILFEEVEREAKRRGVQRWFVGSKDHFPASWLFERLGFSRVETYYSKWVGD
jgi:GNAT superfamily N-acetyltransferase